MKQYMKAMVLSLAVAALVIGAYPASAADDATPSRVTFYKDVLPVIQENCQECHRPSGANFSGMVAPMALMDYREVRPWAKAILKQVTNRTMPPFFASQEFRGVFEPDRGLSDEEIQVFETWIATGAAAGNPADAPEPVMWESSEGWTIGEPDLIITMPEPFWIGDEIDDTQPGIPVILTAAMLPQDRWIAKIEVHPSSELVHHMGARTTPLDAEGEPVIDPLSGGKLVGTAPGDGPDIWPAGYGKLLRKGSLFRFGMHYHKEIGPGTGAWDQSSIGIKFHDTKVNPVKYVVRARGISSRGWEIPPHHPYWQVGASTTFEADAKIVNFMPHMHWRGRAAKYEAMYPDGTSEVLLEVPYYDFAWQMTYSFVEPKFVPKGTRIQVSMWFDNSEDNRWNPAGEPDRPVAFGGMTQDEMNIGWMEYANAEPIANVLTADFESLGLTPEQLQRDLELLESLD